MLLSFKLWHILHLSPFGTVKIAFYLHIVYSYLSVGHYELCHGDIMGIHVGAPIISCFKRKRQWNLASGFCIPEPLPVHTGINRQRVHPLFRFLLTRVDEKSCSPQNLSSVVWKLFLVGVTVQTAVSLSSAIPLGTSILKSKFPKHWWLASF